MQYGSTEFLEYYEAAHQNAKNRYLHHIAHSIAVVAVVALLFKPVIGLTLIALSFSLSWVGHYLFEKNTLAFFATGESGGRWEAARHHITVAVGGVVWTFACFLRLFRVGPLRN